MQERQGVSSRRLFWLAALFTAVAAAGVYVAYVQLIHYRRSVAEHLPANTVFAARLDVEQLILFDPVRRDLLPLVEVLPPAPAQHDPSAHEARLTRLRAAGLNLGLDLREILVATTADQGWLVALGGLFPKVGALGIIEHVLHEESANGWQRNGDVIEFSLSGAALGQAADGTMLVASNRALLLTALPTSSRHLELGLPREGAGGAALTSAAAVGWSYPGPRDWLSGAHPLVAGVRLAGDIELEIRVQLEDSAQARLLAMQAQQWITNGVGAPMDRQAGGADPAGLWARTRTVEAEETSVKLMSSWRSAELERSARELAAWVRRQLAASERVGS
ncbi:MAG: hypothetical protein RL033_5015 [Pseudomonadota bacterium]